MIGFTTIVGVDEEHLTQLRLVWPTWRRHRPEILAHPLLLICDAVVNETIWRSRLSFLDHPDWSLQLWSMDAVDQREKMLSGLVFGAAKYVETPWYLKLDTDAVATESSPWLQTEWFVPSEQGYEPVFVTNPWGYTKPPDAIQRLDAWANTIPQLAKFPDLRLRPAPGSRLIRHPRIISWCFFGRTDWTARMASYCPERLPVPSQDTFLWYCARRRGDFFRRVKMKRFGWAHIRRTQKIAELCRTALQGDEACL